MTDISAAAHAQILLAIREAQTDVAKTREATKPKSGYMGFHFVEKTLAEGYAAIEKERDRERIVTLLSNAAASVAYVGGGDAGPAVERMRERFDQIIASFPHN